MKLNLLFLAMDVLTLLAYPVLYAYSKFHHLTNSLKNHALQTRQGDVP